MQPGYNPADIEKKWQDEWEKQGVYRARDLPPSEKAQKFYGLIEFPYPSGEGLHVGHPRSYTAIDIVTRKKRMEGKDALYPMGWDAFGLPTENYAIKNKIKPQDATRKNIANFTRQIKSLGCGFDWSREINTTDPAYFKWTQWMFLQFYNSFYDEHVKRARPMSELAIPESVAQGSKRAAHAAIEAYKDERRMAYKTKMPINWCPACKIGLANEEAAGGVCERCGGKVEKREKAQWMIRITAYAERLLEDLNTVDYLEKIKAQQVNWIGKSEGASVSFAVEAEAAGGRAVQGEVTVFTTRPDTLFGATYLMLAPENALVDAWLADGCVKNEEAVLEYRAATAKKSDLDRQEVKEKTGVALEGVRAVNPATGEHIPVWLADYVLAAYGTGAIMAVPAHDDRDWEFNARNRVGVPRLVVSPVYPAESGILENAFVGEGVAVNSGFLDGLSTAQAKVRMIKWLEEKGYGRGTTTYKLRDWVFSRQRYWGEPIPIVFCDECGVVPVPDDQLPVLLPDVEAYQPTDTGESPLAAIEDWVNTTCPHCGGAATRETDTMPNWAGSSWYFLRYCDPDNDQAFADPDKLRFWMPVDLYNGGMEHTTLHLLYSRFWHKFLWDLGHIPEECGSEPYARRRSHAFILGEGGVKMSKSKGNVVNPDDVVNKYGADTFRTYEMFMGPYDAEAPWDTHGIEGVRRFLEKVWRLYAALPAAASSALPPTSYRLPPALDTLFNQTVKKVGDDIESLNFNTAVSAMMILVNALGEHVAGGGEVPRAVARAFLQILAPFAPHLTEELWREKLGHDESIHLTGWPAFDASKLQADTFELVIQVNGKVRDRIAVSSDISEEEAKSKALASEKIRAILQEAKPSKVIYVKGRLVSISL